jgi:hypothetical protein
MDFRCLVTTTIPWLSRKHGVIRRRRRMMMLSSLLMMLILLGVSQLLIPDINNSISLIMVVWPNGVRKTVLTNRGRSGDNDDVDVNCTTKSMSSVWKNMTIAANATTSATTTTFNNNQPQQPISNHEIKPRLYLLIGPPKTGTTFLQGSITQSAYHILQQDHIQYLGMCLSKARRSSFHQHQSSSSSSSTTTSSSIDNNYTTCPRDFIRLLRSSGDDVSQYLKQIVSVAYHTHHRRRHALMVNEFLSEIQYQHQRNVLYQYLSQWYDLHIIMTYRRLYEWLPSYFYQKFRHRSIYTDLWPYQAISSSSSSTTTTTTTTAHRSPSRGRQHHHDRINIVGRERFPFDWYGNATQRSQLFHHDLWLFQQLMDAMENNNTTPMEYFYQQWQSYTNHPIVVLNFHNTFTNHTTSTSTTAMTTCQQYQSKYHQHFHHVDPLLVDLFCSGKAIPETINQTCREVCINPNFAYQYKYPMEDQTPDRIATAAYLAGLMNIPSSTNININNKSLHIHIPTNLSRSYVRDQIISFDQHLQLLRQNYSNGTFIYNIFFQHWTILSEFPVECVSDATLEKLYHYSWQAEQKFFPLTNEIHHREGFNSYRNKKKYCSIVTSSVLQDAVWKLFFHHLS